MPASAHAATGLRTIRTVARNPRLAPPREAPSMMDQCQHRCGWPFWAVASLRACTARTSGRSPGTSRAAMRAATPRRPSAFCREFGGTGSYSSYRAATGRRDGRRGGRRGAAQVSPGAHARRARRGQARARREAGVPRAWPTTRRSRRHAIGHSASSWSARTTTTSRWPSGSRKLLADGVDRGDGVRALHDDREASQDRGRLAE